MENEASPTSIRGQKDGFPDWRRIGRDILRVVREAQANRWELTVRASCALIAARDQPGIAESAIAPENDAPLAAQMEAPLIGGGLAEISPRLAGNIAPIEGQ